ncbi:MAG: hypothetical protein K0R29_1784 [Pseudobdellovibrio sp.]|jgi:hypothetical protein|nr:hypothetical protein [Pseudobdellovibrio sp.]
MRKLASITLIVIFSSIYYLSTVKNENSLAFQLKKEVQEVVTSMKPADSAKSETENVPQKESLQAAQTDFGVDLGSLNDEQLNLWLRQESAAMDMTNNDTAQVEIKLKASANTLKPEQLKDLVSKALNMNTPANQRILAAYILTLNTSEASIGAQVDLAKEPLPDLGPALPHTEAELRRTQELALRYMEVDQLAERARTDANARDKLKLLLNEAGSEEVRNYVARKLKELSL